jgi:hypothetical protein
MKRMTNQKTDEEEVWSAIRYLDPDLKEQDRVSKIATAFALLILVIMVVIWALLCFRGL